MGAVSKQDTVAGKRNRGVTIAVTGLILDERMVLPRPATVMRDCRRERRTCRSLPAPRALRRFAVVIPNDQQIAGARDPRKRRWSFG